MTAYEIQPDGTLREVADPPTRADLVQVVRCRDCKHAHHYHPFNPYTRKPSEIEDWYCGWHSNAEGASDIEPDGFCAWGERRDA